MSQPSTEFVIKRRGLYLHRFDQWSASWGGWRGGAMHFDEATAKQVMERFEDSELEPVVGLEGVTA